MRAPANFSQSLLKRLASAMDASNDTLNQSSVNVSTHALKFIDKMMRTT